MGCLSAYNTFFYVSRMHHPMDSDKAFEEIRTLIAQGRNGEAVESTRTLAMEATDPLVRIKCLSLLKVVGDVDVSKEVVAAIASEPPEDPQIRIQVAGALRGLDFAATAYGLLRTMDQDDTVRRLSCMCLEDMEEFEMALEALESITSLTPFDRVMLTEVNSALGNHSEAVRVSKKLLDEIPGDFDVRRSYVSALVLAGRDKDAVKFVRSCLKEKTAESNALAAYVMRILGNTKAAAGYATRAINMDHRNVSAMETLGICLAEKGEYDKARIVAGAINEASPGSRAALNVLSYCEGHRSPVRDVRPFRTRFCGPCAWHGC